MQCPVCNVPLTMSERQGVEIDYCPQCRGVWLDRGELDKVIERSAAREAQMSAPGYGGGGYRPDPHHYRHKHKHKSFLSELFD